MTQDFTVYDPATGQILRCGSCLPDYLGHQFYSGEALLTIASDWRTDYIVDGHLEKKPPQPSANHVFDWAAKQWIDPRSNNEICKAKWEAIKTERDRRKAGGFKFGLRWFHSDEPSRAQYGILLTTALEKSLPVTYVLNPAWKDMSGAKAPLTVADVRGIRDAGLILEATLFAVAEQHKANMQATADPQAYDFSTGWPPIYGE